MQNPNHLFLLAFFRTIGVFALCAMAFTACAAAKEKVEVASLTPADSYGAVWDDPLRCIDTVSGGRRLAKLPNKVRVATWNIRWFPDGRPGKTPVDPGMGTDIRWLACVIAYLDVELLGLQEIKLTDAGKTALNHLTELLYQYTRAPWQWQGDDCEQSDRQHVVLLYRGDRLAAHHIKSHDEIDPTKRTDKPGACTGFLRPALAGYFRSKVGGVDFHFATTHLDSGRKNRDFKNRQFGWQALKMIYEARQTLATDEDFIVAADFNTMGCPRCDVPDAETEFRLFEKAVQALDPAMAVRPPEPLCTEYYRQKAHVLDAVVVSSAMQEAAGAVAKVSGVCAQSNCGEVNNPDLPFFKRVSDHCPVVFDIDDVDRD